MVRRSPQEAVTERKYLQASNWQYVLRRWNTPESTRGTLGYIGSSVLLCYLLCSILFFKLIEYTNSYTCLQQDHLHNPWEQGKLKIYNNQFVNKKEENNIKFGICLSMR